MVRILQRLGEDADLGQVQQRLHRRRVRAEGVLDVLVELLQLRQRAAADQPAVDLHPLAVGLDVAAGDVGLDVQLQVDRPEVLDRLVLEPADGLVEQLAVQLVADGGDVAALLGAEDVARPADLQVAHGDAEAGPEVGVFLDGLEPLGGRRA